MSGEKTPGDLVVGEIRSNTELMIAPEPGAARVRRVLCDIQGISFIGTFPSEIL